MRQATKEELHNYKMYLRNHIDLVSQLGKRAFNLDLSNHDFDKIHAEGDKVNLLALRSAWHDGSYHPSEDMIRRFDELVFQHVKTNKHHPEYWNQNIRFDDFKNGECDVTTDCSAMSKEAFLELCCDWAAVAMKRNKPLLDWYHDKCFGISPRFKFSDKQHKDFIKNMKKIYDTVKEKNIHFSGVPYTAITNFEENKINERHQFIENYILMKESRVAMTFNFKTEYDANLFRREIPYIWTYVDCSKPKIVTIYWDSHNDMQDFMNHINKNTMKLVVNSKVLKEEVSSGTFSSMTPDNCLGIIKPIESDPIKNIT